MKSFEYTYVTGKTTAEQRNAAYEKFFSEWKKNGGTALLAEAQKQFRSLGFIR